MAKRKKSIAKAISKPPRKTYLNRVLVTYEPKRHKLWKAQAAKANVALSTWIRWACDNAADAVAAGLIPLPTGEVADDGRQH